MEQPLNERRQLLQSKIFAHPEVSGFNSYSQAVLSRLSRCHTAAIGVHHYRCSNQSCRHLHYQYHSCGNRHCLPIPYRDTYRDGGMKRESVDRRPDGRVAAHYLFSFSVYATAGVKKFVHGQQETTVRTAL